MQDQRRPSKRKAAAPAPNPPALISFMMSEWKPAPRARSAPVAHAARFRARRRGLAARFPGETLVVPTGREKIRSNDTTYRFRPGSDFVYLTGNTEPDCVLVLLAHRGRHEHVLFVEPNPGRNDPTFFTDRSKGELWVGPRLGVAESERRFGVDRCAPLGDLPALLRGLPARKVRVLRGFDPGVDASLRGHQERDHELARAIAEQRLLKDETEVQAIVDAGVATRHALEDLLRALPRAKTERELEAVFDARARVLGNGVGYGTIVAGGANACVLHWTRNDGPLEKGALVLVDAGVEGRSLYTADVTRTFPVSGRFSREQRELYDVVIAAQEAAFAAVKPGADFLAPHRAATIALVQGLERLRLLPVSAAEALADDKLYHKRYTLHGTSHMLGLDVHDCEAAPPERYRKGRLEPGMVLTVEPGLYFQKDDLTVPARYRGIGIRVEDDVLVTARGHRLLTDIPREAGDVERWVRACARG
jgi:Xaa-Pro aminopeptidase